MECLKVHVYLLFILVTSVSSHQSFTCSGPIDCQEIQDGLRINQTGVYTIFPPGTNGFKVRCDMNTTTGGWTVIQRRVSNAVNFYRTWKEYMRGFGDLEGNFWLGNQQIHMITSQGWYKLRIDMTDSNGTNAYAEYNIFHVGNYQDKYQLTIDDYHGNAGENFIMVHNGMKFTTRDRDNDAAGSNCATSYLGGWWYGACQRANLNGVYGSTVYGQGLTWLSLTGYNTSLTFVEMKIRKWG